MNRFLRAVLAVLVAFSCPLHITNAQEATGPNSHHIVRIPDANLADALRETLALNPDEPITIWEMETLRVLALPKRGISDITGLECATRLRNLSLHKNSIRDLTPLQNLTNLMNLRLNENRIDDVSPLTGLVLLHRLRLADNPVLDLSPLYPLTQQNLVDVDVDITEYPPWDVNEDGAVGYADLDLVSYALGEYGKDIENPVTDVNHDGKVNNTDFNIVLDKILELKYGIRSAPGGKSSFFIDSAVLKTLDRDALQAQLKFLHAKSDGSLKYQQMIALLERILESMRPDKTQLLANYPNPFNPETWIPYRLAEAADVEIAIYDAYGTIVRHLELGHQSSGYYTSRSQAAYWNGRNDFGERVASGIYFYQMQADTISPLRKMVILK